MEFVDDILYFLQRNLYGTNSVQSIWNRGRFPLEKCLTRRTLDNFAKRPEGGLKMLLYQVQVFNKLPAQLPLQAYMLDEASV